VVDTWFSSWLWPISVFHGIKDPNNEDINYYYPTNDLVTAPEILFFWVMRMIIAGYEFRGELPFRNVYLTGIVRDTKGRKMSKSLGNSPDPLLLIDQYGADGVRTGMLFSSPAGNDLLFDEKLCEQGRNFCNKIWNAFRLVKGWTVVETQNVTSLPVEWFESKLNQTVAEVLDLFDKYRLSDALNVIYKLIWDDFCSQYLEMIKPEYGQPIDQVTFDATIDFFETIMALTHPFMPFITEEIWQDIRQRGEKESLCVAEFPKAGPVDGKILADFEILFEIITHIRNLRSNKNISPKTALPLTIRTENQELYKSFEALLMKLVNISEISYATDKADGMSFLVKADEFFVNLAEELDVEVEIENLVKELEYTLGFKKSVEAKLSNERFVQNAKADVVDKERQKLADAEAKITTIQDALIRLKA